MPSNECVVSISENNTGDTTLFISGSITLHNMDAVLPEIKRLLEDKNLPKIYADLINIDFIDSAGAMLLLQLENELKERSVKLELINIPDKIRGIMTLLDKNALVSKPIIPDKRSIGSVSYTHLRAHETVLDLVCRLLLEKKKQKPLHLPSKHAHIYKDMP